MITGQQIQDAMKSKSITSVIHHDCGCCGAWTEYRVEQGDLLYDSSCDCGRSAPRRVGFQDAANWINMQSEDSVKVELMARFGLDLSVPEPSKDPDQKPNEPAPPSTPADPRFLILALLRLINFRVIECHGDKCRLDNCESCNGDDAQKSMPDVLKLLHDCLEFVRAPKTKEQTT